MPAEIKSPESLSGMATYRRLIKYTLGYRRLFIFAALGMAIYAFAEMQLARFIQILIDDALIAKDPDIIKTIPIALMLIILARCIGLLLSIYFMSWISRGVILNLRTDMFNKLLLLPTRFYDKASSGEMTANFSYNVEQIAESTSSVITTLIQDCCLIIFLVGYMFYTNAKLALVLFITAPLVAIIMYFVSFRFRKVSKRIQQTIGKVTHIVNETVDGHQVVRIFGGEQHERNTFAESNQRNFQQHLKLILAKGISTSLIQLIAGATLVGVIYLTTSGIVGEISPGVFSAFILAMVRLSPPLKHLTNVNVQVQRGIAAAQSIFVVLDAEQEIDQGSRNLKHAKGQIEYQNVSFRYEPDKPMVLQEISFSINPGETIALVGRSGSGKSTIAKLLPRLYDYDQGKILLDGYPITEYQLAELRQQIGFVGQHVTLFNDTVANNIAYGSLQGVSRKKIEQAARDAYAWDFIEQLPAGLDTIVGENGVLLSGGQRQRLAIARALLKDAPILILDEATSALDTESEQQIQAALDKLRQNRTTLVIAHRLSTIENADRIIVLDKGKVVESGDHKTLLTKNGQYASLHKLQFNMGEIYVKPIASEVVAEQEINYYSHNFLKTDSDANFWDQVWYSHHPIAQLLAPLGYLFSLISRLRYFCYKSGIYKSYKLPVPVIVVGNLTVGGTGKTPLVIAIVEFLRQQGYQPGIISRGYKGKATNWPITVTSETLPQAVGDEAVMIAQRTGCPMVVDPKRYRAAQQLLSDYPCDVIITDDGLQHYALQRDIEIIVADGQRGFGNGMLLPAGPLREPKSRLLRADYVITNSIKLPGSYSMYLRGKDLINLADPAQHLPLKQFAEQRVHAVAAIGNPERFFHQLEHAGLEIIEHRFNDHYQFIRQDLVFNDDLPILMTEKDAVKCRLLNDLPHQNIWYYPVSAVLEAGFLQQLQQQLESLNVES